MIDEKRFQKTVTKNSHNLILEERNKLNISGVIEVVSFNDEKIELSTEGGRLEIGGFDLKIQKILVETGDCLIEGEVSTMVYRDDDNQKQAGLFARLFK